MTDVELEVADSFARIYPVPSVGADWDDVLERAGVHPRQRGSRLLSWRVVAVAAVIVLGALLVTPALGLGHRVLDLVREPFVVNPYAEGRVTRSVDGVRFSLAVHAEGWENGPHLRTDWRSHSFSITKNTVGPQGAEAIIFWTAFPEGGDAARCDELLNPAADGSAADLAAALAKAPGTTVTSGPRRVTVGGRPAWHVGLTVRRDRGCDPGFFFTWRTDLGGAFWNQTRAGDRIRVWLVDVGNRHLVFAAVTRDPRLPLAREITQIVRSIRFE